MCRPPTQDSLVSWIDHIQENYPRLKDITIVYDVTVVTDILDWNDKTKNKLMSHAESNSQS